MTPGSIFYHISFQSTFICIFTFPIYITKYQKYIYLIILSLSDLTFASGREGIDNPFIALVASSQFVCVNMLELLVFAFICLCLREYAGVACVCLYLLGSLVFVRSLLEYAGVCLNLPGYDQVGLSGCGPVRVDYPYAARIRLSFNRIRLDLARMRSGSTG